MTETECRHHWLIEAPNGMTSPGRCKVCGAERDFNNCSPWEVARAKKLSSKDRINLHRSLLTGAVPVDPNSDLYVE